MQIFDCNLQIQTEILDIKATDFPVFIAQEKKAAQSAEIILSGDAATLDESMVLHDLNDHGLTINAVKIKPNYLENYAVRLHYTIFSCRLSRYMFILQLSADQRKITSAMAKHSLIPIHQIF